LPDQPLFYDLPAICKVLHAQQPAMSVFKYVAVSSRAKKLLWRAPRA
jgi:hypothetical protein